MSADLFAEFGTTRPSPPKPQDVDQRGQQAPGSTSFNFFDDFNTPISSSAATLGQNDSLTAKKTVPLGWQATSSSSIIAPTSEENDDWGDFEDAEGHQVPSTLSGSFQPSAQLSTRLSFPANGADQGVTDNTSTDPFGLGPVSTYIAQPKPVNQSHGPHKAMPKGSRDPAVLFDIEDEDDFGDFEESENQQVHSTVDSNQTHQRQGPAQDVQLPSPTAFEQSRNTLRAGFGSTSSKAARTGSLENRVRSQEPQSRRPASPLQVAETDSWDDFADWDTSAPAAQPTSGYQFAVEPGPNPSVTALASLQVRPGVNELPPTNVPPPGVVLSLFPPLFSSANEKLFKPMATQSFQMKNRLASDPATVEFLHGYLVLASVAAHIIAGRKLRWKRDMHLSQGMKIGPASSRGTSGMKLTGIDKGESMKEDREVQDVIRVWREQIGRLRSVVAAAKSVKPDGLGIIPDVQESMFVTAIPQAQGGIPAPSQCALCGLRRDERVQKVDHHIEDSFGEWWIEQMSMHRACRNFWQAHKKSLQQH